jgi:1,2-phenylacetyl-CoA epoxidase catalytic subunit
MSVTEHPYYLVDSKLGKTNGFSTLDQAREAMLAWILLQRQAGETVVEQPSGQWSDSRVTRWVADTEGEVMPLDSRTAQGVA